MSFLALDRRVQTELVPNRPGFLRRTTARHGDDWLVVTLWASEDDAAAFQRVTEDHPLQVEFDAGRRGGLRAPRPATKPSTDVELST